MVSHDWRAMIEKVVGDQLERVIERRQWKADFEERTVMWLVGIGAAALGFFIAKPLTPTFLRYFGLITLSVSIASGVINRLVMREALALELKFRQLQRKTLKQTPTPFSNMPEAKQFIGLLAEKALEVDLWDQPSNSSKKTKEVANEGTDMDLKAMDEKHLKDGKDERDAIKDKWLIWQSRGEFLFDHCAILFVIAQTALLLSILFDPQVRP